MKTKLLKRLRRQANRNAVIPVHIVNWICQPEFAKFCNDQLRDHILYRVANMRRRRARRIIRWTVGCIVMCSLSMVTSFIYEDWHSGMAWFCATLAWMVVVKHEKQEYKEK